MEACRAEGVPVPALLALETIDEDGEELETMVVEEAPGHPLKEVLPALTESEQRIVLSRFGETLRRIHQVPAGGFYQRDAAGRWDFPDWSSIMASALENRAAERELLARAGLGSADVDALLAAAERYGREFPCERPVLCHGDFSTRHVFVDDELRISAVLDFGQLQGGARELDLGRLLFDRFPPALEAVVAGYGAEALAPDGDERLRLGALLFGLGVVAHLVSIGLLKDIDENVARLRALL
jgi:aminoglycoside phosphotransferase (APT) family kinase protein